MLRPKVDKVKDNSMYILIDVIFHAVCQAGFYGNGAGKNCTQCLGSFKPIIGDGDCTPTPGDSTVTNDFKFFRMYFQINC